MTNQSLRILIVILAALSISSCGDETPINPLTEPVTFGTLKAQRLRNAPLAVHNRRITIANIVSGFHNPELNQVNPDKFHELKGKIGTFSSITIINTSSNYFENIWGVDWVQIQVPDQFSYITPQGQRKFWIRIFLDFDDPKDFETFNASTTQTDVRFKIARTLEIGTSQDWIGEIQMDYYPLDHKHDTEGTDRIESTDTDDTHNDDNNDDDTNPDLIEGTTIKPSGGK